MKNTRKNKRFIYIVTILVALWIVSFMFPELTVRRYMITRFQPISAVTTNITNMERLDKRYGHLYNATNYKDWATGEELEVFYLKKFGPFWFVSSIGSGP